MIFQFHKWKRDFLKTILECWLVRNLKFLTTFSTIIEYNIITYNYNYVIIMTGDTSFKNIVYFLLYIIWIYK